MNTQLKVRIALVAFIIVSSIIIPLKLSLSPHAYAADANQVDVWWPTSGVHVSGTQPFKAMIQNVDVSQYDMYWQVDGGQLNPMQNNYTDYQHKEAAVDLSGWNWHGSGPYTITFVAKQGGNTIAQQSETIYIDGGSAPAVAPAPQPAPTVVAQPAQTSNTINQPVVQTQTTPAPTPAGGAIQAWWPTPGAVVAGTQPFKAVLPNTDLKSYTLYWQVDGGQLNVMDDSYTDAPHKEASVDVTGWHWQQSGIYTITFVAKDQNGKVITQQSEQVVINAPAGTQVSAQPQAAATSPVALAVTAPAQVTNSTVSVSVSAPSVSVSGSDPLSGDKLYVNPYSSAANQVQSWQNSDAGDATLMQTLAQTPTATWFGDWTQDIAGSVRQTVANAQSAGEVPVLVAYDIPQRDCGSYSAGGASSPSAYQSWIAAFAQGIGAAKAIVVLEPDALASMGCLSQSDQGTRMGLLSDAVGTLKAHSGVSVYIDAGHSGWVDAGTMAGRLAQAGIGKADGFSLNVSNFNTTSDNTSYGSQVSGQLGGKHFVIDTSRNGNGSNGQWCNPSGRAIGNKPTTNTGNALVDAYLWVKTPGESDGACNGGPSAGQWWAQYALDLVKNAH